MKKIIPSFSFFLCLLYVPAFAQVDSIGSGHALRFDGVDDFIDLGNIYDDVRLPLSISAWVYVEPNTQYILPVFASQDNDNVSIYNGFWFCLTSTNLFFEYGDGRGDQNSAFRRGKSAPVSGLQGRWIFVSAVVKSAYDIQLFVNGHDVGGAYTGSSDRSMASNFPDDVARIGRLYTNSVLHRFVGFIDELRIWDRALTVEEIRQNMCRQLNGKETGLIGYWNFDEVSGGTLKDQSTKGHDGVLNGNPARVFSGAPIGDESTFLYTADWTDKTLSFDNWLVSNVTGTPYGVHIYKVESVPSQTGGLNIAELQPPYYGVFLAGNATDNAFDLSFGQDNVCSAFQRNDNSVDAWTASDILSQIHLRTEIIPADVAPDFQVHLGNDAILCDQSSTTLTVDVNPMGKSILWNTGETSKTISISASGLYTVEVGQDCAVARDSILISFVHSPPPFSLGEDEELCNIQPRTLTPNIEDNGFDFTWQDGSKEKSFELSEFGTYWLKIANECGTSADTISLTRKNTEDFQMTVGDDAILCDQSSTTLTVDVNPMQKSILWNTGETSQTINVNTSGLYTVEVRQDCIVHRDSVLIFFVHSPPPFSLGEDQELCELQPRTLKPDIEDYGFDFTWQDGSKEKAFEVSEFGTYWLKIANVCGTSTDTVSLTRKIVNDFVAYNFISPDEDDYNEYFIVDDKLQGARLEIFNRWGKTVYWSESYHNNWSGNGLPAGVYFYTIQGACTEMQKGSVTIWR